ncbi:hypothetical protein [Paraburkholderia tagetis]|uniref:Uncharacterized protein n=1 Tax=Paraburkholderia tagetis TaxID=2913261 RepID=A0A9X1RRJ5_9BURK|nr:hypothetical protein [Paraburkholderia tagetis]MCG5074522.1 hypothetical protein [Paraburkholderia tagetis]
MLHRSGFDLVSDLLRDVVDGDSNGTVNVTVGTGHSLIDLSNGDNRDTNGIHGGHGIAGTVERAGKRPESFAWLSK